MNPIKRIKNYLEWKMHDIAWGVALENFCNKALDWPITEESKRKANLFHVGIDTHRQICMNYRKQYHPHPET